MQNYIGTKIIQAEPMTDEEFYKLTGKKIVEFPHRQGYMVRYPDGYESWSPKAEFEHAYRLVREEEVKLINGEVEEPEPELSEEDSLYRGMVGFCKNHNEINLQILQKELKLDVGLLMTVVQRLTKDGHLRPYDERDPEPHIRKTIKK